MTRSLSPLGRLTLLCIASLTIMVGSVVAPGLLPMAQALGVDGHPAWLMTLPSLGAIVFAPLAGRTIDNYGVYNSLLAGLFLYGLLGVTLVGLDGPVLVYADRLLLGGVTALVMAATTMLIAEWYRGAARLDMIAKQGMAIELGGVLFLFIGGQMAGLHWAMPLALYLLAWLFLGMLHLFVPPQHPGQEQSADDGDAEPEQHQSMSLKAVFGTTILSMSIFFAAIVLLPITLSDQGYDEAGIGYVLAFISLIAVIAAYFMPRVVVLAGHCWTLTLAFALYSAAYLLFWQSASPLPVILAGLFLGFGFGFTIPLLNHLTVSLSKQHERSRNLSRYAMSVFFGQFLTSFISMLPDYKTYAFIYLSVVACALAIVFSLYRENRSQLLTHDV